MKIVFSLFVVFILFKECGRQHAQTSSANDASVQVQSQDLNQSQEDMVITYEANTRGFYEKIWITKDFVSFSNDRNLKTVIKSRCKEDDWKALVTLLKDIDIKNLPELESPTKMHQYDGAAMATLSIEKDNETYETKVFDHGHPPKAISELVNKVLSMKEKITKQ